MNVTLLDHFPEPETRLSSAGVSVSLRGLTRAFGAQRVLRGVDLDIPAGQVVAIVGRSGCGKSTLLRLITGLDRPTAGSVTIDGGKETVRLMFQEPRLLPWRRVLANVEVGLPEQMESGRRRRRAAAVLAQVGLVGREGEWPSVLSGGQQQRVALARALASEPRLLALDEPLGALDALTRIEMRQLIELVWRDKGFTMIIVTHDVVEAVALADRILLIEDGGVAMDVTVDLPRPRHHGDAGVAAIEGRILDRLLQRS
jgi:sulfonate transport system ATP-binding protein